MIRPGFHYREEYKLLLSAVGSGSFFVQDDKPGRLLVSELDWDLILRSSRRHGVAPLLHSALRQHGVDGVPASFMEWCDWYASQVLWRSVQLTAQLAIVVERFEAEGIQALPFKGPTLSVLAFGALGLREFSDLDVLIRPRDLPAVERILATIGFQPEFTVPPDRFDDFVEAENALGFRRASDDTLLEIHWALAPKYLTFIHDPDELWASRMDTWPGGRRIPTLGPEHLLLYLCVHGAKHCWERLSWVVDVARLMSSPLVFNWDRVFELADTSGSRRMLLLGLYLAAELFDAPLPDDVKTRIPREPQLRWLADQAASHLSGDDRRFEGEVRRILFQLRMRERWSDRLRHLRYITVTPTVRDFEAFRFPKYLSFLYQLVRPFRLVRDYALSGKRT